MKIIGIVLIIIVLTFAIGIADTAILNTLTDHGQVWYAEYVPADELKSTWSKSEIKEMERKHLEEQQKTDETIYQLTNQLTHFEGTEQEKKQLEQYVNELKAGKMSVNVDHILAEKINKGIDKAHEKTGVEKELIRAVMKRESNFDPTVVSKSGAQGLMQIMPETGKWLNLENPWDIEQNIMAGAIYLRDQLKTFNNDYRLALAAYNAGPGAVKKAGNKIPNYAETQAYVPYVLKWYNAYKEV